MTASGVPSEGPPGTSPRNFTAFWPIYLADHASARTRVVHACGTLGAFALLIVAAVTAEPYWLLAALLVGYGPAWATHVLIEHNRPQTFSHPLWSLRADLRMTVLLLLGRLPSR